MKRFQENKKGQFIIIAVMMVAIMIVSIGALLHDAVTYYKHEPWEEYSTLIGDIEINSRRLLELSLADYTTSPEQNGAILGDNLQKWQDSLMDIYPNSGIALSFDLADGGLSGYLSSTAVAKSDFTLNISSIGLKGYKFKLIVSLTVDVIGTPSQTEDTTVVVVAVTGDDGLPVKGLEADDFKVNNAFNNATIVGVSSFVDTANLQSRYKITYKASSPSSIEVRDHRGIRVVHSL